MKTKLLITGLALMAITTLVSAQTQETGQKQQNGTVRGRVYVDNNKNSICDNYENGTSNSKTGRRNFYCRYNGQGRQGQAMRSGRGMGRGQHGTCRNRKFVDTNNNGICDNYEATAKK